MNDNKKQSDMKWYVIRAATGYEDRVMASLRLLIENQNIQQITRYDQLDPRKVQNIIF